jgi:hypothetical protein
MLSQEPPPANIRTSGRGDAPRVPGRRAPVRPSEGYQASATAVDRTDQAIAMSAMFLSERVNRAPSSR